eukprot:2246125-Prymnesium_polylepis.1
MPPDLRRGWPSRDGRCRIRAAPSRCCGRTSSVARRAGAGAAPTTTACDAVASGRGPCVPHAQATAAAGA